VYLIQLHSCGRVKAMLFTPDDPEFAAYEAQHRWFEHVLLATWNELEVPEEVPVALDWLAVLPPGTDLDIEEVECSLAYVGESGYTATIWDASGVEDDLPWAVFLVDDFGARLLAEYSLFEEEDELPEACLPESLTAS
jgi:hypothetical protein